jgi:formylglycine-generating enzyme required for sulfatase activity
MRPKELVGCVSRCQTLDLLETNLRRTVGIRKIYLVSSAVKGVTGVIDLSITSIYGDEVNTDLWRSFKRNFAVLYRWLPRSNLTLSTPSPLRTFTLCCLVLVLCESCEIVFPISLAAKQSLSGSPKEVPKSQKRWALIIGVDRYEDDKIPPLSAAVNDAKAIAIALERHAGFSEKQIILLCSDQQLRELQPTRSNILGQLFKLSGLVPKDGLFMFVFVGHGVQVGDQAYLLASDSPLTTSADLLLPDTAISVSRLQMYLRAIQATQVIAVLDACRDAPIGKGLGQREVMSPAYKLDLKNEGIVASAIIYSTSEGKASYENNKTKQGYFSQAFVEALEGRGKAANEKGEVTLGSLKAYLEETVPKRVLQDRGPDSEQKPFTIIGGSGHPENLVIASKMSEVDDHIGQYNTRDGLVYVLIPKGQFFMGCGLSDSKCQSNEKPRHQVNISDDFYIGRTEVTVGAYRDFCERTNHSLPVAPFFNPNWREASHPIVSVTWQEAGEYCRWAGGRLATEAEWEYAARGGRDDSRYQWGETISHEFANFGGGDQELKPVAEGKDAWKYTAPVGQFSANGFGVFDTAGNVWEWTADWYAPEYYKSGSGRDPLGPSQGRERVIRGGSWGDGSAYLRSSARNMLKPEVRSISVGFRCVLPSTTQKQ